MYRAHLSLNIKHQPTLTPPFGCLKDISTCSKLDFKLPTQNLLTAFLTSVKKKSIVSIPCFPVMESSVSFSLFTTKIFFFFPQEHP